MPVYGCICTRPRCSYFRLWCRFFFLNDTATTEIYTLSLHDALPILYHLLQRNILWVYPVSGWLVNGHNRSEEHTSELRSPKDLVCRLLLEKKKNLHQGPSEWEPTTGPRLSQTRAPTLPPGLPSRPAWFPPSLLATRSAYIFFFFYIAAPTKPLPFPPPRPSPI